MENITTMLSGGNTSIYITDMNRAVRFYTDILGFRLITRIQDEWAEIDAGNGLIIGLHPARQPETPGPGTVGAINIELKVGGTYTLDMVVSTLQARGVTFRGQIASYEHVRLATMTDPDGNVILLAEQLTK